MVFSDMYAALVWQPLKRLYLLGPSVLGLGFWEGQSTEDICAQLSTAPSSFWVAHLDECQALIDRHLRSFVVMAEVGGYAVLGYRLFSSWLWHWTIVRPIVAEIHQLRGSTKKLALEGNTTAREHDG